MRSLQQFMVDATRIGKFRVVTDVPSSPRAQLAGNRIGLNALRIWLTSKPRASSHAMSSARAARLPLQIRQQP